MKRLILAIFLIFISGLIFLKVDFIERFLGQAVFEKSSASLSILDKKLSIKFNITNSDREIADSFAQNLGVDPTFYNGILIEVDPSTLERISGNLPSLLTVDFNPDRLTFSSPKKIKLSSSQVQNEYNFATGSSQINLKVLSDRDFELKISDPKFLVDYATHSSKLVLSQKLEPLFPIISKIGKITVKVNGKNIDGEIQLK